MKYHTTNNSIRTIKISMLVKRVKYSEYVRERQPAVALTQNPISFLGRYLSQPCIPKDGADIDKEKEQIMSHLS